MICRCQKHPRDRRTGPYDIGDRLQHHEGRRVLQHGLDARDRVYDAWGYSAMGANSYTAHGIGVDSLEPPWVPGKERMMEENMMINLHPAIGFADPEVGAALGGISIADNVLVGPDGGTRMVDQTDEWIVLDA